MSWITLLLLAILAPWVLMPLRRRVALNDTGGAAEHLAAEGPAARRQGELREERDRLLRELRELEQDYQTGKLNPEDWELQRALTARQASAVLELLEAGNKPADTAENLIAAARRLNSRSEPEASAGWVCPACGRTMLATDGRCLACATPRP